MTREEPRIVEINPFRCKMWRMHDRLTEYLNDDSCSAELESFRKHGQRVPALGRAAQNDRDYDVELIYGARRLYIARKLCRKLLVELRQMTDQEAIVAMDIENRHRQDVSPYERGTNFRALLRDGFFVSQAELARALGLSDARVSRLLKFADIPAVVVAAFPRPVDIKEAWGVTLADHMADPGARERIVKAARSIMQQERRPGAKEVFRELLRAALAAPKSRRRNNGLARDEIVRTSTGEMLFRVSRRHRDVHIILPVSLEKKLSTLTQELTRVLMRADD